MLCFKSFIIFSLLISLAYLLYNMLCLIKKQKDRLNYTQEGPRNQKQKKSLKSVWATCLNYNLFFNITLRPGSNSPAAHHSLP